MRERKAEARLAARARRKAIPPSRRAAKEAGIAAAAVGLPEVEGARVAAVYVAVQSEVGTRALIDALLKRGKRVAVPVVTPPEEMRLAEIASPDDLAPGAHGIPEPRPPRVFLDDADVVFVPGLLFTRDGHRLGQGGGYFDRMLARMPGAFRVGLAFEEQLVDKLPLEVHDEPMDAVVTDARVLRAPPRRASASGGR